MRKNYKKLIKALLREKIIISKEKRLEKSFDILPARRRNDCKYRRVKPKSKNDGKLSRI